MDILNFISWIKARRKVTTVDPAKTLLPVAIKDNRRDDSYITGAISVADFAAQIAPQPTYKIYTALLTQTGTDAPVATVLENTLGGELVWSRNTDGEYAATLAGAFPDQNKFFTLNVITAVYTTNSSVSVYWNNSNSFALNTANGNGFSIPYAPADDILYQYPIEIRVYN